MLSPLGCRLRASTARRESRVNQWLSSGILKP
jgi:hypothetical protein